MRVLFVIDACGSGDHRLIGRREWRRRGRDGARSYGSPVGRRFSATKTPHGVKWLSDNGSASIAADTADIARARIDDALYAF